MEHERHSSGLSYLLDALRIDTRHGTALEPPVHGAHCGSKQVNTGFAYKPRRIVGRREFGIDVFRCFVEQLTRRAYSSYLTLYQHVPATGSRVCDSSARLRNIFFQREVTSVKYDCVKPGIDSFFYELERIRVVGIEICTIHLRLHSGYHGGERPHPEEFSLTLGGTDNDRERSVLRSFHHRIQLVGIRYIKMSDASMSIARLFNHLS